MTEDYKNEMEFRGSMREISARQKRQERAIRIISAAFVVMAIALIVLLFSEIRRADVAPTA